MSCCAPGTEGGLDATRLPGIDELRLESRALGNGLMQTELSVPAIHCGACITLIERELGSLDNVESARVNLSSRRVTVCWKDDGAPQFVEKLSGLGYPAHLFDTEAAESDKTRSELMRAIAVSGFAAGNIMLLSVSVWSGADGATRDLFHWLSALIALPALLFAGRIYFRSAWNALKHGRMNMDVPIALGVSLAFGMSLYETLHHGEHAYFDASVSLLFFLLIGRTLDHVMRDRARAAVKGLVRLSPKGAVVLREDGSRNYLPLGEITVGMQLLVAAGERVPVDGIVVDGLSDMDCSLVNGESAPQPTNKGDAVRAGTLNLTGPLTIRVTAVARESFLAEIVRLMEAAESGRGTYRRIADRASALYSPVVHLTALLTCIGWLFVSGDWHRAITIAIAVLIITCPCALGLAVPIVQVVAARRLFENGIMVKDGSAMERLAEIDTAVFDKTGTLTAGHPVATSIFSESPRALEIASALAALSRHPSARAIVDAYPASTLPFEEVREHPGLGISAQLGGKRYRLGRACWALRDPETAAGAATVLGVEGACGAGFSFTDRLRADAPQVIATLRSAGIAIEMLSGDRTAAVTETAKALGIDHWQAEVLPGDKVGRLNELALEGHSVLMVGDGLNDAPALAAAHVSMAPASAADIGRNAADFVFLRESLSAVPLALSVSREAGKLIRQNFALAIGYNALAVPVAILGYVTPLVAAIAMSVSSILVIANALRLRAPTLQPEKGEGRAPALEVAAP
ncbi:MULTISPECIES: cation-translocating P-type ATPase [unclassified Rhizobium]|uniref:cation-translocating P-type ATPase n=1 Tax=unclassified Rhizobium TaxID=2613769 RepID=UPI0006FE24E6|nr:MULTISPECIES: cation-translocating P-type ATPase [unclassified Rhizobium]KQV44356.1 nitrogen fixation protein FixI [Rhizobium sp. Root1212]KRD38537.1 nitrogen fixation protein FixI [Rhizobium sp. Root268]